ncbi:MAG: ParA family protein [Ruminococcaceae bacterium]|nr:ParA family protein [Oscillospiraceae bacterium]
MEHKRLTLFAGHYGSGKTNIAVNYAMLLADEGKRVCIADLDIVNPYFRTKDSEEELTERGITLISPRYANSNVDLPALPAESYRPIQDHSVFGVLDIGGDDRGAYALGRFADAIKAEGNYRMAFVINRHRPLTSTVEDTVEIMREIEAAAGIRFTCIVNNSNIGSETTSETVLNSLGYAEAVSRATELPIWLHTAEKSIAEGLSGIPVLPLTLQKKYFDLPN